MTRGVSEVISTIMLNAIATFLVALPAPQGRRSGRGQQRDQHQADPASTRRVPGISVDGSSRRRTRSTASSSWPSSSASLYWFVLGKTRFGFDLRATGRSETAAVASGVKVKRMVLTVDGHLRCASPGWSGMPLLFGQDYNYGDTFQSGLGFAGIAIALLGRNNPIGIAFAALLWAYLDAQGNGLQINAGVADRLVLGHPGRHRLSRRHRLRAGPPGRTSGWSSGGSPASSRPPEAGARRRKERRHERHRT